MLRRRLIRRLATASAVVALVGSLAACDQIPGFPTSPTTPSPSQTPVETAVVPTATCGNYPFDSVFSAYGSVHYTLLLANKLTLYLDMFTEQKTHDWFPKTPKYVSFTLHAIDSAVPVRAKFARKREVYMGSIDISADTKTDGGGNGKTVYEVSGDPRDFTLDPEALEKPAYGLLITSPKGGFELNHQRLGAMADGTIGFDMNFSYQLSVEKRVGSNTFKTKVYSTSIPVAVFTPLNSTASTSCATSATLKPEDGR